tara:strand:+ start:301 stop:705 length:405 start_codon:yes stop_codon:yes gene_type:complete
MLAIGLGTIATSNFSLLNESEVEFQSENKAAAFPGGDEALQDFIKKNLRYPNEARRYGKVIVEFTVKKSGKCTDFTIVKSVIDELDFSAVETLQGMPMWEPAIKNGKKVESKVKVDVLFKPEDDPYRPENRSNG